MRWDRIAIVMAASLVSCIGDQKHDTAPRAGDGEDTDTDAICGWDDLVWSAETRDSSNTARKLFDAHETIYITGVVDNPCAEDVYFTTPSSCLFGYWILIDSACNSTWEFPPCQEGEVEWLVGAGDSSTSALLTDWIEPDSYALEIHFGVASTVATWSFTVQPPPPPHRP